MQARAKLMTPLVALSKSRCQQAQQWRSASDFIRSAAATENYQSTAKMWAAISAFIAFPAIVFGFYNMEKREHEFHESHPDGPTLPNWEWNRMVKPFPWGNGQQPLFEYLFQRHQDVYPGPDKDE